MKYCTYCGAELTTSAAAFCPECGKSIDVAAKIIRPDIGKQEQASRNTGNATDRRKLPLRGTKTLLSKNASHAPLPETNQKLPRISHTQKKKPPLKKKPAPPVRPKTKTKKAHRPEYVPVKNPMDENYDGYYNDRLTDDNGQNKETVEPELIKRIVLISAGAVILVALSIVIMYLL